jgi:hypothetical protein
MKRMILLAIYLFQINSFGDGYTFQSPLTFIPSAKTVYLVTVTSVVPDKVTFTVNEVLRGKPVPELGLKPWMGNKYRVGSYWILASDSHGADNNLVGFEPKRSCGWIPMSVSRKDGQSFIVAEADWVEGVNLDMASDGTKGLTLEHVRRLLQQKITK